MAHPAASVPVAAPPATPGAGVSAVGNPALWIDQLFKRYDGRPAVEGLSLAVARGEVFGLIGPNGAGKTTTLKVLVGLLKPDYGRVVVDGHDILLEPYDYKASIGYLPESSTLPDYLTGEEFLSFVGRLREMPRDALRARIADLFRKLDLEPKRRELIVTYSKGMRQKIAFAASVLHGPMLLILDEPLIGVDPAGQYEIKSEVREVTKRGGSVIVSTHMLDTAEKLCDRLGVMHHGRLAAMGTLADLQATAQTGSHATLEEVFLRLTEEAAMPPPPEAPRRRLGFGLGRR
jgi:ABC-2 type transport system ATP-binding protein